MSAWLWWPERLQLHWLYCSLLLCGIQAHMQRASVTRQQQLSIKLQVVLVHDVSTAAPALVCCHVTLILEIMFADDLCWRNMCLHLALQ